VVNSRFASKADTHVVGSHIGQTRFPVSFHVIAETGVHYDHTLDFIFLLSSISIAFSVYTSSYVAFVWSLAFLVDEVVVHFWCLLLAETADFECFGAAALEMLVQILVYFFVALFLQVVEVVPQHLHFLVDFAVAAVPLSGRDSSLLLVFDASDVLLDEIAVSLSLLLLLLLRQLLRVVAARVAEAVAQIIFCIGTDLTRVLAWQHSK
jgi:hypothetical protein